MAITSLTAGKALSQSATSATWKPGMQVKMYAKGSSPAPSYTVVIGTESYIESQVKGGPEKKKLKITQKDLSEILAKFAEYRLTEIHPVHSNMTTLDGSTHFLVFNDGEKEFMLVTGSQYEFSSEIQKQNKEAIYGFLIKLVDKANK